MAIKPAGPQGRPYRPADGTWTPDDARRILHTDIRESFAIPGQLSSAQQALLDAYRKKQAAGDGSWTSFAADTNRPVRLPDPPGGIHRPPTGGGSGSGAGGQLVGPSVHETGQSSASDAGVTGGLAPIYDLNDVYAPDRAYGRATNRAISDMVAEKERVEAEYQARRAEIRSQFSLAETAGEKKALLSQIAALNTQSKNAHKAINQVYGASIRGALEQADYVKADAAAVGAQAAAGWDVAAGKAAALAGNVPAAGAAFGMAGQRAQGPAVLAAGDFTAAGANANTAALAEGLAAAGALRGMAGGMGAARAASHVETNDRVTELSALARADHAAQVSERINADRRYLADALGAAADRYSDTRRSLTSDLAQTRLAAAQYEGGRKDDALSFVRSTNNENAKYNADTLRAAGTGDTSANAAAIQSEIKRLEKAGFGGNSKKYWGEIDGPVEDGKPSKIDVPVKDYENLYRRTYAEVKALREAGTPASADKAQELVNAFFGDEMRSAWAQQNELDFPF